MDNVMQFQPLRAAGDTSGPETPESLFLSAMLASGEFTPERYGVSVDDLTCWKPLWEFCATYQAREGCAPPVELVRQRFPTFEPMLNAGPTWSSGELLKASLTRRLRSGMRDANNLLGDRDSDPEAALEIISGIRPIATARAPLDGLEPWLGEPEDTSPRIEVPFRALQNALGGIGRAEFGILGARPGVGKTHIGSLFLAKAMKSGWRVGLISLEMPGANMRRRVNRALIGSNKLDLEALDTPGLDHMRIMARLKEQTPGKLDIIDPSYGRITPNVVRTFLDEHDLVMIDHIGLLGTNAGGRAVEDWRNMGGISNQLMEDKLATGTPILGLAQLNRKADEGPRHKPPGKGTIAGADTITQDADWIITMSRMSMHVMAYGLPKNREGPNTFWYSRFDPGNVKFDEMNRDQALDMSQNDEPFE